MAPDRFYSTGLHEFAKVYRHLHPDADWPRLPGDIWNQLEIVSGMKRERIQQWINLPLEKIPVAAVTIVHFFVFPEAFKAQLPELYGVYARIFEHGKL